MSVPPPPNQWGSQPPTGGQPVGAQPWGPPPGGQPGGAPQWGPQQPWGPPPGPPPRRGGKGKWIFGGIALLAVIAVTVVITVLVVGKDSGNRRIPTPTSGPASDIASANDKGPVDDHHRRPDMRVDDADSPNTRRRAGNGWDKRDPSIPASAWTPAVRAQYRSGRAGDASCRRPNGAARQADPSSGDARTLRADHRLFARIRGPHPHIHPTGRQARTSFPPRLECHWRHLCSY